MPFTIDKDRSKMVTEEPLPEQEEKSDTVNKVSPKADRFAALIEKILKVRSPSS